MSEKRDEIDGVPVAARTKAKLLVPAHSEPVANSTVDEVLLENGQIIYQCVHPHGDGCTYTATTGVSVRAHQKAHGPTAQARRLRQENGKLTREAENAATELAKIKQRKSEASRQAWETRRQNRPSAAIKNTENPEVSTKLDPAVEKISDKLIKLARELEVINASLRQTGLELLDTSAEVEKLRRPAVDPDVIDKAQRFDQLRGLMS